MKFKLKYLLFIIPVLIAILVLYFTLSPKSVNVRKVNVSNGEIIKSVSASGFVKSSLESNTSFQVPGKVVNLFKKEGDSVRKGDLIAQVSNEDVFYEAESARKRKDSAQRSRDIYKDNYQNDTEDVGGDTQYNLNIEKLTDDLRYLDNLYKASLATLKKTYLYAPFDGTITSIPFEIGDYVLTSSPIKMSNLGSLEFQADLDQEDYKYIKSGQEVLIVLDAYPEEEFKGTVYEVPFYVDEESATNTFKIKISIENQNNTIVKGMTGDANIIIEKSVSERSLPFDAVYTENEKNFVWVLDKDNKLRKQFIEIGLEGDTQTSVLSDLPEFVVIPNSQAKDVKEGYVASF
jgi:RND family efflux transporter MFP subunit